MAQLKDVAGVLIPGGFGERGVEGKIKAARYAREHKIPYLGLCLGMQVATIEFARNVCGLERANSTEFDKRRKRAGHLIAGRTARRDATKAQACGSAPGRRKSRQARWLKRFTAANEVMERHRHRYEFNMKYRDQMSEKGFMISGTSPDGDAGGARRAAGSSLLCRLPISSRISEQAEQATSAFQRFHPGMSRASSRPVRRAPQPIHNRRPESLIRNWFCNDKIEHRARRARANSEINSQPLRGDLCLRSNFESR